MLAAHIACCLCSIAAAAACCCLLLPPPLLLCPLLTQPHPPPRRIAVVDHDTQLVAGEWLPALEGLGEDEREAMHKLMQVRV